MYPIYKVYFILISLYLTNPRFKNAHSDTNGNGRIEIHELAKIMLCFEKNLTEAELQEMIKEVDTDKSGSLDLVEFLNLMTSSRGAGSSKESKAEFFKAFDDLDVDKDGVISFKDLKESVKHLDSTLSDVEIMEMYREISNKNKETQKIKNQGAKDIARIQADSGLYNLISSAF